jgi:hypothetical protein
MYFEKQLILNNFEIELKNLFDDRIKFHKRFYCLKEKKIYSIYRQNCS